MKTIKNNQLTLTIPSTTLVSYRHERMQIAMVPTGAVIVFDGNIMVVVA